ncbi:MAG TPA: dicarboxylate/amino acid:cation symporter [Bacteriovoracaceae bacterium]|nr:dicarboxylate/amino acid:cation symporter [Bacteriovoracaceae bacterium]
MSKLLKLENLTLLGSVLGILCGLFLPELATKLSILGELFILLLKMVIVPLVFVSVYLAIAGQQSRENLSKLGIRTTLYFFVTSSIGCITGFIAAFFLPEVSKSGITYENYNSAKLQALSLKELILGFFTANPFKSFAEGNIVQIVMVSLLVGIATLYIEKRKREVVVQLFDAINDIVMVLVRWILLLTPIGVFSLVASIVATTDKSAFGGLGWLFLALAVAMLTHLLISLPALGYFVGRFNPYRFLVNVKEVMIVAISTASSSATLPVSTRVLKENEKVNPATAGFVLPLGATINMDGSTIYQTLIVLFFAGLAGIHIGFTQQIYIFFLILVSSVGTAGVPGGGILMMGAVLQNVGVPMEYLGLYLLIDRLWDPPVTMINVVSDLFGAKIIDRYQIRQ